MSLVIKLYSVKISTVEGKWNVANVRKVLNKSSFILLCILSRTQMVLFLPPPLGTISNDQTHILHKKNETLNIFGFVLWINYHFVRFIFRKFEKDVYLAAEVAFMFGFSIFPRGFLARNLLNLPCNGQSTCCATNEDIYIKASKMIYFRIFREILFNFLLSPKSF